MFNNLVLAMITHEKTLSRVEPKQHMLCVTSFTKYINSFLFSSVMDKRKNMPSAFFAFYLDAPKYEIRDRILRVVKSRINIYDANSPWKINIFHMAEFKKYTDTAEAFAELQKIYGEDTIQNLEVPFISTADVILSHYQAKGLYREDKDAKRIIDRAKDKGLNYILYGVYNDRSNDNTAVKSKDVMQKLVDIVLGLSMKVPDDFRERQIYAYAVDDTLKIFPKIRR